MPQSLPQRRFTPTERTNFIVYVLWVSGWPATAIGSQLGLRKAQVLGVAQRGPWPNRSTMTDRERAAALAELAAIRCGNDSVPIDGGLLPDAAFQVRPLMERQRKAHAA